MLGLPRFSILIKFASVSIKQMINLIDEEKLLKLPILFWFFDCMMNNLES